jgi:WD40 repeat protein
VTSSNDLSIHFWDITNYSVVKTLPTPEIQQCVKFCPFENGNKPLLFTGGNDYVVHIIDLIKYKSLESFPGWNGITKNKKEEIGHSQPIIDIAPIIEQNFFASAGLDGRICLWDIRNKKYLGNLTESKKSRGINKLDWLSSLSVLLSAGSDHKINVYNTFAKEQVCSLSGHTSPVVSVKWIENSYDVVSVDSSGVVKLWDYRSWSCYQTLTSNYGEATCLETGYSRNHKKRIFVGGKGLCSFNSDEPRNKDQTDTNPVQEMVHNQEFESLITIHKNKLKVWNLDNGKLLSDHANLLHDDISAFCLDTRQRKFFISDYKHNLSAFNINTGALVKKYSVQVHHN